MDVFSHALWAGAAAVALRRRRHDWSRGDVAAAMAFGAAPDLVGLLPVTAWAIGTASPSTAIREYVAAIPGTEPSMAPWARLAEHHLHCAAHSVLVAGLAALLAWRWRPRLLRGFTGWWLHLGLDVPTHSEAFYAVTLFYPLTEWSFDGIAWTTPWLLGANWVALALTYAVLLRPRPR